MAGMTKGLIITEVVMGAVGAAAIATTGLWFKGKDRTDKGVVAQIKEGFVSVKDSISKSKEYDFDAKYKESNKESSESDAGKHYSKKENNNEVIKTLVNCAGKDAKELDAALSRIMDLDNRISKKIDEVAEQLVEEQANQMSEFVTSVVKTTKEICNNTLKNINTDVASKIERGIFEKIANSDVLDSKIKEIINENSEQVIMNEFKELGELAAAVESGDESKIESLANKDDDDIIDLVNKKLEAHLKFINNDLDEAYEKIECLEKTLTVLIKEREQSAGVVSSNDPKLSNEVSEIKKVIELMTKQTITDNRKFTTLSEKVTKQGRGFELLSDEVNSIKQSIKFNDCARIGEGNSKTKSKTKSKVSTTKRGKSSSDEDDLKVFTAEQ